MATARAEDMAILQLGALALATFASASLSPRDTSNATFHGVGLALVFSPWGDPVASSPAPVELNVLTDLHNFSCYRILFDKIFHPNVDVSKVECRAYKDEAGLVPGSAPFNYKHPANLATNLVQIGSVLCYTVTDAEAAAF